MGLADLESVDLVTGQPDGDQGLWIVASLGWPPEREALEYVQLIIKVAGVLNHAAALKKRGQNSTVIVHSAAEPPTSVLDFLHAREVAATVGSGADPRSATGRPPRYPNLPTGSPDIDVLQTANAAEFAERHSLDGSVASLTRVDGLLEAIRHEDGLEPGDTDKGAANGDLIVLAGAYAGEVLRSKAGGEWQAGAQGPSGPVHVSVGPDQQKRPVDVLGHVGKSLRYGSGASVHDLIESTLSHLS